MQTLSGMVRRSPAAACVQIRLNIQSRGFIVCGQLLGVFCRLGQQEHRAAVRAPRL